MKIEHNYVTLIIVKYCNFVSLSFPEKRLYYVELSKQFFQHMHNERERPYKRASEILELTGGYLIPSNSVESTFKLPA